MISNKRVSVRFVSFILLFSLLITLVPPMEAGAEVTDDYTEVTEQMCHNLYSNIESLKESFAYDSDTSQKLIEYRTTYNNYIRWDDMYGKETTKDIVTNETELQNMEEAYQMIALLDSSYRYVEPFEGLSSYYNVSESDFIALRTYSSDPNSSIKLFTSMFSGAPDSVLSYFDKAGTQISDVSDNLSLGATVQAVYLFVENNEMVFMGTSTVRNLLNAAPETSDVTKATYDHVYPMVESVGIENSRFETDATESQSNAINTQVNLLSNGIYSNLKQLYQDYSLRCKKIAFEKKIDDLYERIYTTMDTTTLAKDDLAIREIEDAYNSLPTEEKESIVNYDMVLALRKKYENNLTYYNEVIQPANEVSERIENDFWRLFDLKWPQCADVDSHDSKIVEDNILSADAIIQSSTSAYNSLTSSQKKYVSSASFLDYMKKTLFTMNVKYLTKKAKDFYPCLQSDQILSYKDDIERAFCWINDHVSADVKKELETTLIDQENADSNIIDIIKTASKNLSDYEDNMGALTEKAIRDLVTKNPNGTYSLTIDGIETIYRLYLSTAKNPNALKKLTSQSKYEIEALHGLAMLAQSANQKVSECNQINLTDKENSTQFKQSYEEVRDAIKQYDDEYEQVIKDFKAVGDGSEQCLISSKYTLFTLLSDFNQLTTWSSIIHTYDQLGTITKLDSLTIASIRSAWNGYVSIIGADTTIDPVYAGFLLRQWNDKADHIDELINLSRDIDPESVTEESILAAKNAKDYFDNTLTNEEQKLVPEEVTRKINKLLSVSNRIDELINAIAEIKSPTDDATYITFHASLVYADKMMQSFEKDYPDLTNNLTNESYLSKCQIADDYILLIREQLKIPSAQMCDNLSSIQSSIQGYEELPTQTQEIIYNSSKLYSLYQNVTQANDVRTKMSSLLVLSLKDKDAVVSARKCYDSLSQAAKQYVSNYNILVMAEKQLAALETNSNNESQHVSNDKSSSTETVTNNNSVKTNVGTKKEKISIGKAKIYGLKKSYNLASKNQIRKIIKKIKNKVVIKIGKKKLKRSKDYRLQTKVSTNKKKIQLYITGIGNYKNKKKVSIKIVYSKKV